MRISDWSSDVCSSDLRVDGIVQRRLYEECTDVRAGQALFAIDPRELRASLNAVEATLARARAAAANAQQDVNRYQGLIAGQAISKQEYRSEEHTSELQSLMRISYAVFCLKKKNNNTIGHKIDNNDETI